MSRHPGKTRSHDMHLTEAHTRRAKTWTIITVSVELVMAALVGIALTSGSNEHIQGALAVLFAAVSTAAKWLQPIPRSPRPAPRPLTGWKESLRAKLPRWEVFFMDMGALVCAAGASAILSTKASNWWAAGPLTLVAVAAAAALFRILKGAASSSAQDLRALASQHREEARRLEARATELDPPQTGTP